MADLELTTNTSCLRPDGKWCEHPKEEHGHNHPYQGQYCKGCMLEDGDTFGPFIHDWNPCVLTEGGWLPLFDKPQRVFQWQFTEAS